MHDCRKLKGELIDLAFEELSVERKLSLLVEIENCTECSSQYGEITEALYAVDEAATRALPGEAYWLAYDQALLARLKRVADEQPLERMPLWKQFFAARLPVPVPIAALVVLLLIVSTTFSLRTPRVSSSFTSANMPPPAATPTEIRVPEAPVVHEKIVTRIVYVERKARRGRGVPGQPAVARAGEPKLVARDAGVATTPLPRTGLAGFQPADDVKLTIIKAHEEEKR